MSTRTYHLLGAVLACAVVWRDASASESHSQVNDAALAESLTRMGCQVELAVKEGTVTVASVRRSEPLSEDLFLCLQKLRQLRSLRLRVIEGQRSRALLRGVALLPSLHELSLSGKEIDDQAMEHVGSLTNLESLILWDVSIGEKGLALLSRLKTLKRLELSNFTKVSRRGVEAMAGLRDLEHLRINGQFEETALLALRALPKLGAVSISGDLTNDKLAELKAVPTIERVEITRAEIDVTAARHLLDMRNLHVLKLECCAVTPEAVKVMQSLRLHELDCAGIATEVLGELANGMAGCYGDLHVWY